MRTSNKLRLPHGMRYACLKCGRGCEDFEEIVIDPATLEWLMRLPMEPLVQDKSPDSALQPPWEPSPFHPGKMMLRKVRPGRMGGRGGRIAGEASSACCFLREDKLCALHCTHGIESKPIPCRSFPFGFTETPDGTYAGLSFACTAVLQNYGPAVTGQIEDVARTREISPGRDAKTKETMLAPGVPLTWEQYLDIESDLNELISTHELPISSRLIAQSAYLQLLTRFLHEARADAGAGWGNDPKPNDAPLELFRKRMAAGERRWERLFALAERPSASRLLRRVFLGYVLAFRDSRGERLGRVRASMRVIGTYMKQALGLGAIDAPRLAGPIAVREFSKVRFDPARADHDELLTRFFSHCIFRKDLLVEEDIRFAHNMMLMHYGLIHWHAAAFAVSAGHGEVGAEDLMEAVRTVEQYYVYHSQFSRLFSDYPMLRGIMEQMFHRPIYAFAMARHE